MSQLNERVTDCKPYFGLTLWCLLVLPPVRHALQGTMTLHMLVQIPLLGLAGWCLPPLLPHKAARWLADWNANGISGLILASLATMVWMVPLALDAALDVSWVALAKFIGVPLLIGLPLGLSWPRASFVVRGIFLLEVIATTFRLGWLYLASPQRLCSNYLLGDQQQLGRILLVIGMVAFLLMAGKLLGGHFNVDDRN